ncbi:MAG: type III-B CRISPR module RAMP protein Cmr1 [Firmicutes bacterium]|nr:type III-B CRISPR module RAMP protein Cmr1 [Bacillota bacterium]
MRISRCVGEIITPLAIGGALPRSLELRSASVKGVLRFWWRAINADLPLDEMKKEEGGIFGSSAENQGRSKFSVQIPTRRLKQRSYSPIYHERGRWGIKAFVPGQKIAIVLRSRGDAKNHKMYEDILQLALLLGGLGKRTRRGFGCIELQGINEKEIFAPRTEEDYLARLQTLLEACKPGCFSRGGNRIWSSNTFSGDYPWVRKIEIGKAYQDYSDLLAAISVAAHDHDSHYTGFAGRIGRFASPIYVSVIRTGSHYRPIITTLNTAFAPGYYPRGRNTQSGFKGGIL